MALLFQTPLTLDSGIVVNNAYGRVAAVDTTTGLTVDSIVDIYVSEAAFTSGLNQLQVSFNRTASVSYDRATMGTDILDIAHDALVASLGSMGIVATKQL